MHIARDASTLSGDRARYTSDDMTNADLIVRMLSDAGVRWAFGVPSGPVLPLMEAMRRGGVEYVLTASETTAGYMAAVVGQLTGIPGVCVSTLGPGATNLTTGVGGAWLDRAPVLAITCNVGTAWLGRRIQMRIDHHALFEPITKASFALREGCVGELTARALAIASDEPPGPVHLDLPEDVAVAPASESPVSCAARLVLQDRSGEALEEIAKALASSRRPLIIAGLTFTRCRQPKGLLRFIEKQRIPYLTTAHAKGFLPESHANWVGVIGRARRTNVQGLIDRADLIIAVGYDPVEINFEEWAGNTPIVHVSTEAAEPGQGLNLLYNRALDLDLLLDRLAEIPVSANDWLEDEWAEHRVSFERALRPVAGPGQISLHSLLDILRERLPADGILAYDVGAHHHQVASQWRTDSRFNCLSTNGWSSMGIAMPAAYAAKLVYPDRAVVALLGDGCFHMTAGELNVARRLNLSIPHIVVNDGWLSLIRIKQDRRRQVNTGVFLGAQIQPPAHYFGVPCQPALDEKSFAEALDWGLELDGPSVIEAMVNPKTLNSTVYD
jgi:acetolactate synthase I/II/III large subunit